MRKNLLFLFSLLMAMLPLASSAATWSFEWNLSKKDGGQGFYNFGSSAVEQESYAAELNGLQWYATATGTYTYAYTPTNGQYIGKAKEEITSAKLWTNAFAGKIKAVKVSTRMKDDNCSATVAVTVNGKGYLCGDSETAALTKDIAEYTFSIADADAQEGELDILWTQTPESKQPLYVKKIEVEYEASASGVAKPTFTPAAGTYDEPQQVALGVDAADADAYTIYYTTDGSNPRLADGTRKAYSEPILIGESTTLKAAASHGDEMSEVAEAKYVIRKSPDIKFNEKTITLTTGDEGYADLINPNKVEPITYRTLAWDICSVDKYGALASSYVKKDTFAIITASFAGNDVYYPQTDTLTVYVKAKAPLKTPEVTPLGGTFTEPVEVKVSTDDADAVTIWYSTTAQSAEEFEESDYTESTVVEGHEATIAIDHSCTLYVMTRGYNQNSPVVAADYVVNLPLTADFTTDRAVVAYYDQEFDSIEGMRDWKATAGWTLANRNFSSIKADDKYSVSIAYNAAMEGAVSTLTSPELTIADASKVEFYAYFAPNYLVWGKWTFNVTDLETSQTETLFNVFDWAQDNAYNSTNWNKFSFDLSAYAGKKVQFSFDYPFGGEDLAIDGFRLVQEDPAANEQLHIFEGEEIAFSAIASEEPDAYQWSFPGADVETSDEASPVAKYSKAGTYDVSLTITRGDEKATAVRKNFVVVTQKAPTAIIGLPEEGYESPFVGVFVPLDVPVTFRDLSTGNPTEWNWVFQNTDKETSTEQNPTVTYVKQGRVSVGLTAKNDAGQTNDILAYAIQAGGAQYVWNISSEENSNLSKVELGYYGNYAGSNWLGMEKFAEKYKAPLADATIDSVGVYFASVAGINPDDEITLCINAVADNGEPGEVLASATKKVGELQYSDDDYLATIFHLDKTAEIKKGEQFFITVGPFPNNSLDESPYTADDVSIFCLRRGEGEKTTTWHYLAEEDENYQPTGEYKWYENADDPISMAIAPVVSYTATSTGIANPGESHDGNAKAMGIYTIGGAKVSTMQHGGIYVVRYSDGTSRKVVKK